MDVFLESIAEKLKTGIPLKLEEGVQLHEHPDLLSVAQLAHAVRLKFHQRVTFFNRNLHLNSTNICEADCLFCSFARLEAGMPKAYSMSVEQARTWIRERFRPGMTEIHIVNGLNPNLTFDYYEELLSMIREDFPELHIKAFTAVEIHYFAEKFGMSYADVLKRLMKSGLGSLPGGGAEIFAPRVRKKICRDKVDADGWLEVHRTAHTLGLKSNCTMLYGTIESPEERLDHLIRLRDLQAETSGFQAFIPLAFHNDGNRMAKLPPPSGMEDLRVMAVSRLMLHNIPNIKAYWIMLGVKTAQIAQQFGANDLDGTVTEEKIYHMAGSHSPDSLSVDEIQDLIRKAGFEPRERTTLYELVESSSQAPTSAKIVLEEQSAYHG